MRRRFGTVRTAPILKKRDAVTTNEALKSISAFARELCVRPDPNSSNKAVEFSGGAEIKLDSIISKIVGLGIDGAAKYRDEQARGILQKDLAGSYKHSKRSGQALIDAFRASPHRDIDIAPPRAPMPVRDIDL